MFSTQSVNASTGIANPRFFRETADERDPRRFIQRLNRKIDQLSVPYDVDESILDNLIDELDRQGDPDLPEYWLLIARLAEMALLCAGHYADAGEFTAAGDLVVNPRSVLIYQKGHTAPMEKPRHTGMTEALGLSDAPEAVRRHRLLYESSTRVAKEPILSELVKRMRQSGYCSKEAVDRVQNRIGKVATTIGFLAAWGLTGPEELHHRLETASEETRQFVASHLCRFDDTVFQQLGEELQQLESIRCSDSSNLKTQSF